MAIIIKTPKQIEGIRNSCVLAAKTLKHLEQFIVPGVTTGEINDIADSFIRDNGATPAPLNYKGFPKSVCTSVNEVICHGIPGDRKLLDGDIINVDVTTILDGYFGDTCRMYSVGEVSEAAQRLMSVTKKCLEIGIDQVKPNNRFGQIGHEIKKYANSEGYSVVWQFCGHGVGLKFHEDPQVNHADHRHSGPRMLEGMTFTIEPMINEGVANAIILEDAWTACTADNRLSAQYEHTVLVTKTGCEILTLETP